MYQAAASAATRKELPMELQENALFASRIFIGRLTSYP